MTAILQVPAMAVLALGLLLHGDGARRTRAGRVRMAAAAAVLLHALAFAARWAAARHPVLTPAMYLVPMLPLLPIPALLLFRRGPFHGPFRPARHAAAAVRL